MTKYCGLRAIIGSIKCCKHRRWVLTCPRWYLMACLPDWAVKKPVGYNPGPVLPPSADGPSNKDSFIFFWLQRLGQSRESPGADPIKINGSKILLTTGFRQIKSITRPFLASPIGLFQCSVKIYAGNFYRNGSRPLVVILTWVDLDPLFAVMVICF